MELIAHRIDGSRALLAALLVSMLANAFLIGFLAERTMRASPMAPRGLLHVEGRAVIDRLPADHQQHVRTQMKEFAPELRPQWAQLRQLRSEINALAAAGEPDVAAIEQKFAEVRAVTTQVQARVQNRLLAAVLKLPPDARQTLASPEATR
jgi:uncharacterized membrane protein